jgi:hypothetical protein
MINDLMEIGCESNDCYQRGIEDEELKNLKDQIQDFY